MLCKRLIACLDIGDGKLIKNIYPAGRASSDDVLEAAKHCYDQGIDELLLYDMSTVWETWGIPVELVEQVASQVFIPLAVGGRLRSMKDCVALQVAGTDKINLNTTAATTPRLISQVANELGTQRALLAIDVRTVTPTPHIPSGYEVYILGGRVPTGLDAVEWAKRGQELGAGEIIAFSHNAAENDGNFDIAMTRAIADAVSIPVVAAGGGVTPEHVYQVLTDGNADAALVSPILDNSDVTVQQIKEYLMERGLPIRRMTKINPVPELVEQEPIQVAVEPGEDVSTQEPATE